MTPLKIDFVSDVACPWCAVGLASLESALRHLGNEVQAELHFQPFELNPQMGPEGQDITEHRLASERLARQERQIAEAGRVARIGFYRRDLSDNAITATPEFFAQHGLRPAQRAEMEALRRLVRAVMK